MDKYDEQIFNFLTIQENFENMLNINGHFAMIRERLLINFWQEVLKLLQIKLKKAPAYWRLEYQAGDSIARADIKVYKEEWKRNEPRIFAWVGWGNLQAHAWFGIWNDFNSGAIDSAHLKTVLKDYCSRTRFKQDPQWWLLWRNGSINFADNKELIKILPSQMQLAAEEYADNIIQLLPQAEKIIDGVL